MRKTIFLLSCGLLFACDKPISERQQLEKAAAGGDAIAQFNLGVKYAMGEGVTKDEATEQEQIVMGYLIANPLPIQWSHSMQEEIRRMYNAWAAPTGEAVD